MKRWKIWGVCLLFLLLICPGTVYGAGKDEVGLTLEYGYRGNAKSGSCFPVRVTVENQGAAFEGTLEMEVPVLAEVRDVSSSIWMSNSDMERSKDRVYTYQKKISMKQGETCKETFYLELPLFEGYLCVYVKNGGQILAEKELNCNFSENYSRILVGIVSDDPEGITELDGTLVDMEQGYDQEVFVKTIPLEAEEIYANPDALHQLDLLIADQGTDFSGEQRTALDRWKADDGFYLERNGENLVELFLQFISGEQREAFQLHLEEMQTYSFGETEGLDLVPVNRRPSMGIYLFLLFVYIILAGPGIYLLLKKQKKQKYLWAGVCALSVAFLGIIWMFGRKTSMHAPFISYCGLYEQQDHVWSETANIGIQAPYNDGYHLYLDQEYRLLPLGMGSTGMKVSRSESAEQVKIAFGKDKNKVTLGNMSAFTQNLFKLEKNKRITDGEMIQINLEGKGKTLQGNWKNPTGYAISNAILVMKNRAAVLGELEAGGEGNFVDNELYSCGNGGMEVLMNKRMDFSKYEYPEYEILNMVDQNWQIQRSSEPDQAYLLGIVQNPDLDFQENSGYEIFGSALIKIPVDVNWEKDGKLWCPNLEVYGEPVSGEFSAETNLMNGKEATVDYSVDFLGKVEQITLSDVEFDEEKYYFPFRGHVAVYSWETGLFEEIHEWNRALKGEVLKKYLSDTGVIRIRYLLDDTVDAQNRSCMLPCLQAVGKVE